MLKTATTGVSKIRISSFRSEARATGEVRPMGRRPGRADTVDCVARNEGNHADRLRIFQRWQGERDDVDPELIRELLSGRPDEFSRQGDGGEEN